MRSLLVVVLVGCGGGSGGRPDAAPEPDAPEPDAPDGPLQGLEVAFAGTGSGEVQLADDATGAVLATCTAACSIPVAAGRVLRATAATPSELGGLVVQAPFAASLAAPPAAGSLAACVATGAACTFTVPAGTAILTATFGADPKERWTRLPGGAPIHTAAYDAAGNLVVGRATGLLKLAPDGTTLWTSAVPAVSLAIGPADSIYVVSTAHVVKLDAAGATQWMAALDASSTGCTSAEGFAHCIAVAPDGAVAVHGAAGVARWTAAGAPSWSKPLVANGQLSVAIDPAGVVHAAVESPITLETIDAVQLAAADGAVLGTVDNVGRQYHGMIATTPAGALIASASGHSHVDLRGASFERRVDLPVVPAYIPSGVAAAGTGDLAWLYYTSADYITHASWTLARYVPAGTSPWAVVRAPLGELGARHGTLPLDVAASPTGAFAVVGNYDGLAYQGAWIQTFGP